MLKLFKKYFIPHHQNDHKPHFLRLGTIVVILLVVVTTEAFYLSRAVSRLSPGSYTALVLPNVLVDQTNMERESNNLNELQLNPTLVLAAQMKADDMAQKGYFSHTSPDGKAPWYWLSQAGYNFQAAGENLAINYIDSIDVTNGWMNSPTHRANILKSGFTEIGIATAQGMYKGQSATFVVQFFGAPHIAQKTIVAQVPTTPAVIKTVAKTVAKPIVKPVATSTLLAEVKSASITETQIQLETIPAEKTEIPSPTNGQKIRYSTLLEQWISSPSHILTVFFGLIILVLIFALLLKIFIKMKIQHPTLIANGVILLLIIISLISFNFYLQTFGHVL